jgi:hypothetical protein
MPENPVLRTRTTLAGEIATRIGWGEQSEPQRNRSNDHAGLGFALLTPTVMAFAATPEDEMERGRPARFVVFLGGGTPALQCSFTPTYELARRIETAQRKNS